MLKILYSVALLTLILAPMSSAQNYSLAGNNSTQTQTAAGAWLDRQKPEQTAQSSVTFKAGPFSARTQNQGRFLNLQQTVSSMPYAGSDIAPGNLALRQQKLSKLQRTTLDPLVNGNDAVFGDEGAVYQGFTKEHRLINVIPEGLSTGHPSDAPDAGGYAN
jgi:hypothetical protein